MQSVVEQSSSPRPKATMEDLFVFRHRLESLESWRTTYGGTSALREVERLYAMRRSGDKRLDRYLIVPMLPSTGWYWKRSGEGRQAAYAAVCPWCLPGPPGSGPYVQGRYMGIGHGDLGYQRGEGPWHLECTECGREGTVG